jgi:hypothetical protein
MARELAGYLLLAAFLIAIAGTVAWLRYNSRDRTYSRRVRSEAKAERELEAARRANR